MAVAVGLSVALHAFVAFGVGFRLPDPSKVVNTAPPIEVILVNARTQETPAKVEAYAQANLDGGGNTDAPRRAKSPLPAKHKDSPAVDLAQAKRKVEELEQKAKRLMAQVKGEAPALPPPSEPKENEKAQEPPQPEFPDASELMSRSMQLARLQAQIEKDWESYQKRPRRKFIGARATEYRFARYVEDWRMKIERVGNLNYPDEARRNKIFGNLVVTVSIKSDGEVEKVEINRSSGHKVLDEAALRIVKLAAPFAPFPENIRKDTDILVISRTWIFTRSDQLIAE
jgi:protein TonB